jgi:putative transposase
MLWFIIGHLFSTVLSWIRIGNLSDQEKNLEILLLRQQLALVERQIKKPLRASRIEKLTLAVVTATFKTLTHRTATQLRQVIRLFQPETVLKWHRELVRRKWTYRSGKRNGRPRTIKEVETLIVRMVHDNPGWGYDRLEGELRKLGYVISDQTIGNILARHGMPSVPQRQSSGSWRHLMQHYKQQILACDFFTIDTLFLQTIYVLFFIELGTRRVYFAGCTLHPTKVWVTQQARQLTWQLEDKVIPIKFLIHDRDTKFVPAFNTVFQADKIHIIRTPFRAPNANAYAERWVRTVRRECLSKIIVLNETHLRRVLKEYIQFYNMARPHQGLDQQSPIPMTRANSTGAVCSRSILQGIVHDYYRAA